MRILLLNLLLFVSVLSFSQEKQAESPKITIKLPLGETILLENYSVTFTEVLEDSRCPKDVTCIWAGRAKIVVEITETEKEARQKELIFGEVMQGESSDKVLFTYHEKKVIGLKLTPYPATGENSEKRTYVLLIYIEN